MSQAPRFEGSIGSTWRESQPWWPPQPKASAGAPNILIVLLDDVGFSDIGCYGSEIATPRMDALAAGGLRYNNFHVTAMCSPTRACLLTGRNAHSIGMGVIAEWAGGYPGYRGKISRAAATIPEVLAPHAYASYAVGKWHLMNMDEYGSAGPHDGWPLGRGFNRWYGFHGALADQWNPELFQDNRPIRLEKTDNYHLSVDLVDHAIGDMRDHLTSSPQRPFFHYVAFGACHWPHHVPSQFIDKYQGRYAEGWDVVRERRFKRQLELGIVPAATVLAPRNPGVPAWDGLAEDTRRVSQRLQETYAGFMEHTDTQIGRLIDFLQGMGQLDNTIVILLSDNGASPEGGAAGAVNARRNLVYEKETSAYSLSRIAEIGGDKAFNHYATGWAQVSNTPLKWYKRGNHGGGIRAPLIVHWPKAIKSAGQIRSQYHHVIDIAPTLYELLNVEAPRQFQGVEQLPVHGTSMAYSFDQPAAPTHKTTQIFEMLGDRAIWHMGWKAVARHPKGQDFATDQWELYQLDADFSECNDLASLKPQGLAELVKLWDEQANRYQVYPLDDRETERLLDRTQAVPRAHYDLLAGMSRIDRHAAPDITDRGYRIDARFVNDEAAATQGVILSYGSWFAGLVVYVKNGLVHCEYLYSESARYAMSAPLPVTGPVALSMRFERKTGNAGVAHLAVSGKELASMNIPKTWPINVLTCGMNCGRDGTAPVSDAYAQPFAFTGSDLRVRIELEPSASPGSGATRALKAALKEQ
jgi:arylsulfatase A-like enzyme